MEGTDSKEGITKTPSHESLGHGDGSIRRTWPWLAHWRLHVATCANGWLPLKAEVAGGDGRTITVTGSDGLLSLARGTDFRRIDFQTCLNGQTIEELGSEN